MKNNCFKNRNSGLIKHLGLAILTQNKTLCGYAILGSNFIHTSAILYSEKVKVDINELLTEKVNDLQLVKYNDKVDTDEIKDLDLSSFKDVFPWFINKDGQPIDFNKPIRVFDSIELIANYLEKRHNVDKNFLSEVTITKLIEPLKDKGEMSIKDFFDHITTILKSGDGKYQELIKNLHSDFTLNINSENINTNLKNSDQNLPLSTSNMEPLGQLGNTTINQVVVGLRDLKWELVLNHSTLTLNVLPLAFNATSYTLMLRSYITHIHNRPFEPNLSVHARRVQEARRARSLLGFAFLGAPLALICLRQASLGLKDVLSIELKSDGLLNSGSEASNLQTMVSEENNSPNKINTNNANNDSWLFLLLSKINKKIPNWIKLIFKFLFWGILVIKLLGFKVIYVLNSTYYLRIIIYIFSSLSISYQLLTLYFIYRFSQNNIKISELLPDFIIKWLKEFEIMCESKESIKFFKTECYIQIYLYIGIIIFVTLIT